MMTILGVFFVQLEYSFQRTNFRVYITCSLASICTTIHVPTCMYDVRTCTCICTSYMYMSFLMVSPMI